MVESVNNVIILLLTLSIMMESVDNIIIILLTLSTIIDLRTIQAHITIQRR